MTAAGEPHLFCFGFGYSAAALARLLRREGWRVSGTCRDEANRQRAAEQGVATWLFDRERPLADAADALASATDLLISVPPDGAGDPAFDVVDSAAPSLRRLRWVGYLSTTGVYGDTKGLTVDEEAPLAPTSERSRRRVAAEQRWRSLREASGAPIHVFRLAGIYGLGRSALDQVRRGEARRIDLPDHKFSRIHVEDIAKILRASMARPAPGRIYNVCDDEPATPAEVVAYACALLGAPLPPLEPFEEAAARMSPMALSFWRDHRLVDNGRIKRELSVALAYPNYRAGLDAIFALGRDEGGA